MELRYLFSASLLITFNICTKFCENISEGFKLIERTRFSLWNLQKEHNSKNNISEVTILTFRMSSDYVLHLYLVSWNHLEGFQSYWADTIFKLTQFSHWNLQRGIIALIVWMELRYSFLHVVGSCNTIVLSFVKISRCVSELLSGHNFSRTDRQTDGRTDRQTDRQPWEKQYVSPRWGRGT